jgi:polyhydroxybutyrate depolymerase
MKTFLTSVAICLAACSSKPGTTTGVVDAAGGPPGQVDATIGPDASQAEDPLVTARPFELKVPTGYTPGTAIPLVVLLHGYSATAQTENGYLQLGTAAESKTFLLALPNGTKDGNGNQFWNATDACCAFGETVDDVGYLTAVVNDVKRRYTVDPKRVFLVGHSNGGFMSYRMACDRSAIIAGIVSLAGMNWKDESKCSPTAPVSVLHIHGTADTTIAYNGGVAASGTPAFPSAMASVNFWSRKNACTATALSSAGANLNLSPALIGDETKREVYTGCPPAGAAELWTMEAGSHIPNFSSAFATQISEWMAAHPKQ